MKNIILIISLLLLALATYFFVFNEEFEAVEQYDSKFKLENASENTTKIEIIESNGLKITLEKAKNSDAWFCNKYYLTRKDAIDKVLEIAEQWRIEKPITKAGTENIKERLLQNGKQIKYYFNNQHETPEKHFYINGTPPDRKGAYMILEGAENPYVVMSPAVLGSPEIMFHTNIEKWRTHKIFGGDASYINKLSVNYPANKEKNFSIERKDNELVLLENDFCPKDKTIDKTALKTMLDKVAKLNIESFDNTYSKKEEIIKSPVYCEINIFSYEEKLSQEIKIYRMPVNDKSKMIKMPEGEKQLYDVDRFYATMNKGKDFVIIQQFAFEYLFSKTCASFFKEE